MGKKRAKLFKILLAIIVVALLISTGIYFYRKADPDNQLIAIENDLTALAQDFTNQNFDAVKKHFTDDAVFVFEGSEIPYAEGIEKIKAELTSDFSIEFIMRSNNVERRPEDEVYSKWHNGLGRQEILSGIRI